MTGPLATAPTLAAAVSGAPARLETVGVPAQVEAVGGAAPTAVAAILVFLVAVVLSVAVTYRYARGYLRTRQRPLLVLTVGMLLLAPAPMFIRLLLGNVAVVTGTERTLIVTVSRLCGLLAILSVVHPR
ncbi:hypothetical protein [Haloglomus litoreum]|uniref:hypothetical protein n=1 Tax=Haloglomus litoreum TaxID=3034026 RepID=UPI0023E75858|nr:hypothetical protein [Haloglomus sp. DT116]